MSMFEGQRNDWGTGEPGGVQARREMPECTVRILDWVESQSRVTRIWLDQLIAEGDPNDMVSVIHRQAAWLELMRDRLKQAS